MKTTIGKHARSAGMIDRRGLIKGVGASGLALATGSLSWSSRASAAPVKGGSLKMGCSHGQTTDSLEPGTYSHGFMILLSYNCHAKLTVVATQACQATPTAMTTRGVKPVRVKAVKADAAVAAGVVAMTVAPV